MTSTVCPRSRPLLRGIFSHELLSSGSDHCPPGEIQAGPQSKDKSLHLTDVPVAFLILLHLGWGHILGQREFFLSVSVPHRFLPLLLNMQKLGTRDGLPSYKCQQNSGLI